jgi:hypothetical protein
MFQIVKIEVQDPVRGGAAFLQFFHQEKHDTRLPAAPHTGKYLDKGFINEGGHFL